MTTAIFGLGKNGSALALGVEALGVPLKRRPKAGPQSSDLRDSTRARTGAEPQEPGPTKAPGLPQGPGPVASLSSPLRMGIGAVLFLAWGVATIVWVASTVYSAAQGAGTRAE